METLFGLLDWLFFTVCACFTLYLLYFALFSLKKRAKPYPPACKNHQILVLFPAYREDSVIVDSVRNFQKQEYPSTNYDVLVISDGMQDKTVAELEALGINVLTVHFEKSSKAAALNLAMKQYANGKPYDLVVVMDADNLVEIDFLRRLNDAYDAGVAAIQGHRIAKNKNTEVAVLDAASEEINHSIFRKGQVNAGLSSALSGSGMAFNFNWFKNNITKVNSVGEDKEIEMLLLLDKIHIDFLDDLPVWDEKVQTSAAFSGQRRRWITAQYQVLSRGIKELPKAISERNVDYCNKIFQWLMPPRVILLGLIPFEGLIVALINWQASIKWAFVYLLLLSSLGIAIPGKLWNRQLLKAIRRIPKLFVLMLLNFLHINGHKGEFIHTSHGKD